MSKEVVFVNELGEEIIADVIENYHYYSKTIHSPAPTTYTIIAYSLAIYQGEETLCGAALDYSRGIKHSEIFKSKAATYLAIEMDLKETL